jgi:cell division transport system permease protein
LNFPRLSYALRRSLRGMRQSPVGALVATATVALSLFAAGGLSSVGWITEQALAHWAQALKLTVYLDDAATPAQREALRSLLAGRTGHDANFVSKAEGLHQLRQSLGDLGPVLDDLPENPLRDALECPLASVSPEGLGPLAADLARLPGVVDVDSGARWVAPVQRLLHTLRTLGLTIFALMGIASLVLVSNTFRLAVYARRDEVEIMKLVGATDNFVRTPFLLEGILLGAIGGVGAAFGLLATWHWLWPRAVAVLTPLTVLGPEPIPLTRALLGLVVAGAVMGLCASGLAVGRFLRV